MGCHVYDVDGRDLIDYVLGYGPNLLGYTPEPVLQRIRASLERGINYGPQHEDQARVAEAIVRVIPCAELVCLSNTGSEAANIAIRIARATTGRRKLVKFEGHYHGWLDPLAVAVPGTVPGPVPEPFPYTSGQTVDRDVLVCEWGDIEQVRSIFEQHPRQIAAVIMEPIACNAGVLRVDREFLSGIRALTRDADTILIFDEVITGFRVALGGAQELTGITPDLCVLGKALAAGMPLSAVAGRADVMASVAEGVVGHRGTFNGNPVSVAAGVAAVEWLEAHRERVYRGLDDAGRALMNGIERGAAAAGESVLVQQVGSILQTLFTDQKSVGTYRDVLSAHGEAAAVFSERMLRAGVQVMPRGLWFLSVEHTATDIARTVDAAAASLADRQSRLPSAERAMTSSL